MGVIEIRINRVVATRIKRNVPWKSSDLKLPDAIVPEKGKVLAPHSVKY